MWRVGAEKETGAQNDGSPNRSVTRQNWNRFLLTPPHARPKEEAAGEQEEEAWPRVRGLKRWERRCNPGERDGVDSKSVGGARVSARAALRADECVAPKEGRLGGTDVS